MKFTIGTISNFQDYSKDLNLIKSAVLYADEIELIGMVEYAVFRYIPSILDDQKSLEDMVSSIITLVKSIQFPGKEEMLPQLETAQEQLLLVNPFLGKRKHRTTAEIKLQIQAKKVQGQVSEQMQGVLKQLISQPEAKELQELVRQNIVSVFDYGIEGLDTDQLAGGYFGSLMGTLYSGRSFPLFDEASNNIISSAANTKLLDIRTMNPEMIRHAGVATSILMTLPTLETAKFDELIAIKRENAAPLTRFRQAIWDFSEKIASLPWDKDFEYECLKLYDTEVAPRVLEINETLTDTSLLKNLGKRVLDDEEIRKNAGFVVGGLAGAITSSSCLQGAIQKILLLIISAVISPKAVSGFLKALNMGIKSYDDTKDARKAVKENQMYYYHLASKALSSGRK